jgi:hypothetical protein
MISDACNRIFEQAVNEYHIKDHVDAAVVNPFPAGSIDFLLYLKSSIDSVQWHLEDMIRDVAIEPAAALALKRRIDAYNQERTNVVEYIDSYFLEKYKTIRPSSHATINTESPAWAIDRLSILMLKVYHMREEAHRTDASVSHREACNAKLEILLQQQADLSQAIDELLEEIEAGRKYMKVYRQMKMYNDPALNPVLYSGNR